MKVHIGHSENLLVQNHIFHLVFNALVVLMDQCGAARSRSDPIQIQADQVTHLFEATRHLPQLVIKLLRSGLD